MILEISLFALYLIVGPVFWILFAIGTASSRRRMILATKTSSLFPSPPPSVTIIVPAKDEEGRIAQCLQSVLAQDYPDFRLLAVDDRSVDRTGKIMDEIAAGDSRAAVLHITDLPAGWTGKNNALHQAVGQVSAPWLLFIDSDVVLEPQALSQTLHAAVGRRYHMLSLILKSETLGFWESLLVPLASAAFGSAYMMGLSNSESNNYYFGNGQFMLFRRDIYDQIGGHEAVKSQYNEDMALARIMKGSGLRPRIFWGIHLGSVRMYDSLASIMRGWSRIFFGSSSGSPWRILTLIGIIVFGCFPLFAAVAWGVYRAIHPAVFPGAPAWFVAAGVHCALMLILIAVIYRWMGNRARYAPTFFVTVWFLLAVLARALWMCLTRRVDWRGTSYSHSVSPPLSRFPGRE
jgi:glycosyltransferase involved in cell wall biosynthesis